MAEPEHVLISLKRTHADDIFSGTKHVELRRRAMSIPAGAIVWIYVKKPIGAVVGSVVAGDAHLFSPSTLWKKFSTVSGLTKAEFFSYFEGVKKGFALSIERGERLTTPVALESLRKTPSGFHPPQFFVRLPAHSGALKALKEASRQSTMKRA